MPSPTFGDKAADGSFPSYREGSQIGIALTAPYATSTSFIWSVKRPDGTIFGGSTNQIQFTPADNGTYVATVTATPGGPTTRDIIVTNVVPTATLGGTEETNGQAKVRLTNVTDPSTADTQAGFKYSFDFLDGDFTDAEDVIDMTGPAREALVPTWATKVWARIKDKDGGATVYGPTAIAITPKAPTGLQATAANESEVNLNWTDNSAYETGYSVEVSSDNGVSWSLAGTTDVNACNYTVVGLAANKAYQFRVSAVGNGGTASPPAVTTATTPANQLTVLQALGEQQPDIMTGTHKKWENCVPGLYRITFTRGAMSYWQTGDMWMVNDWAHGMGFMIVNGDQGELGAPGTSTVYTTASLAQTNSSDQSIVFYHPATSNIEIYLKDSPWIDNRVGRINGIDVSPTFKLERVNAVPTVSVTVDQPSVEEGETDPTKLPKFTFTRTGDMSQALTVKYTLAGRATPAGVSGQQADYSSPSGGQGYAAEYTITIPAGQASATVDLTASNDSLVEGTENVSLSLEAAANYRLDGRIERRNAGASIVDTTLWADLSVAGIAEDRGGGSSPNEIAPGLDIPQNIDHDNGTGHDLFSREDRIDSPISYHDDDLIPVELNWVGRTGATVTLSMNSGTGFLRVWADDRKQMELLGDSVFFPILERTWIIGSPDAPPPRIYLEGFMASSRSCDYELSLTVTDGALSMRDIVFASVIPSGGEVRAGDDAFNGWGLWNGISVPDTGLTNLQQMSTNIHTAVRSKGPVARVNKLVLIGHGPDDASAAKTNFTPFLNLVNPPAGVGPNWTTQSILYMLTDNSALDLPTRQFFESLNDVRDPAGWTIELYGCNTGTGPVGRRFLQQIADLTRADVIGYTHEVYVAGWRESLMADDKYKITIHPSTQPK